MSIWGKIVGKNGRPDLGVGASVPPAQLERKLRSIILDSWKRGYVSFKSAEGTPKDASWLMQDIEVSTGDALRRAPGISLVEDVAPHDLTWLFEHGAADYAAALIAIDPPDIGVKDVAAMVFTNEGIAATGAKGWNVVNVAGILLFSNGNTSTYLRDFDTGVITDISAEIIADTFGNAFGRTFAGAVSDPIAGYEGLRINWNVSNGDPADWSGAGSGNTLLVSNAPEADRIIAIRPVGYDILCVVCRKNIWFGYPTGNSDEPADFRIRFPGIGGVSQRCTVISPLGVITLSDAGVILITPNEWKIISGGINNLLTPLNYVQLSEYYAIYNGAQQRYQLYTPEGVWIYQLAVDGNGDPVVETPGRWFYRAYVGDSAAMFTNQSGGYFWNTIPGTWLDWALTWNEMAVTEENAAAVVFNGSGTELGQEMYGEEENFGDAQDSYWTSPQADEEASNYNTTAAVELTYLSTGDFVLEFTMLDKDGAEVGATDVALSNSMGKKVTRICWFIITGKGTSLRMRIVSGSPEIYRVRHLLDPDSAPAVESAVTS